MNPEPEIRDIKLAVIRSERGPERLSVPGSPKSDLCFFGVEFGGGESKNLLLFFDKLRTHHTSVVSLKFIT